MTIHVRIKAKPAPKEWTIADLSPKDRFTFTKGHPNSGRTAMILAYKTPHDALSKPYIYEDDGSLWFAGNAVSVIPLDASGNPVDAGDGLVPFGELGIHDIFEKGIYCIAIKTNRSGYRPLIPNPGGECSIGTDTLVRPLHGDLWLTDVDPDALQADVDQLKAEVADLRDTEARVSKALEAIARAIGIESTMELIGAAENDEETLADLLAKRVKMYADEQNAEAKNLQSEVDRLEEKISGMRNDSRQAAERLVTIGDMESENRKLSATIADLQAKLDAVPLDEVKSEAEMDHDGLYIAYIPPIPTNSFFMEWSESHAAHGSWIEVGPMLTHSVPLLLSSGGRIFRVKESVK